jgi:hypothetical protein
MSLGINVDFRPYSGAGYPSIDELRKFGFKWARCTSHPDMEYMAGEYLNAGCQVLGIMTGESGGYVMRNVSAMQIGNEWGMGHDASWPPGDAESMVWEWMVAKDAIWGVHGGWFPLVGPGIWCQRPDLWSQVANRLEGITAGAVHCYPQHSGHDFNTTRAWLGQYAMVRSDLPLMCTEWDVRWPETMAYVRLLNGFCSAVMRYSWLAGTGGHQLAGTPELGILTLA